MDLHSRLLASALRRTPVVALGTAMVLAPHALGPQMMMSTAHAATTSTSMGVSAVVNSACAVTATPIAFGTYQTANAAPLDASGQVAVTCAVGTAYAVGLSAGVNPNASVASRKLDSGSGQLAYNLYQDSARSVVWGNSVGTDTVSGVYAAGQQPLTVHGRIGSGQGATAGNYSDTVTVTVTY